MKSPPSSSKRPYSPASASADLAELYERQLRTEVACWRYFASGSPEAAVYEDPGVYVSVFPAGPERAVYNNAVLERSLDPDATERALGAVEQRYADAGIESFAVWVHESDQRALADVMRRSYRFDTSTRAMARTLDDLTPEPPELDLGDIGVAGYWRMLDLPADLLAHVDPGRLNVLVARLDGTPVAGAMAYDFEGDCGIYNVATVPSARRRGLATALTAVQLWNARQRGCTTASIQATEMAERLYASLGFRDLGRYLEFVPYRR